MLLGADAIDRLLHLAMTTIAPFHGVGCRRKRLVVEKRQGLFQIGRLKFAQDFTYRLETADALAQPRELCQRGVRPATSIEQTVHFLHDVPQRSQLRQTARDPPQSPMLRDSQVMLDEKMAMLEEIRDLLLQS